ncbi:NAD(P)-binding protein [Pleomassaria siparia CBS 279.74]|uniref:NAD(P)-binding protein n=1 Tax=Pleomassaria siparia CBS 279.74 TaxID=1314801 RepID=A0A6G1JV95_9PLEO|nr:NAD(P)-binding protein [Pleomassaria siparia CBS 279.74]
MVELNLNTTGEQIVAEYGAHADGKTFVVTGPSAGGLGAELLITLAAAKPAHFVLLGRTESKITPVIERIRAINPDIKLTFLHLDLLDNSSVRKAAADINAAVDTIDVLINNAGVAAKKQFSLSKDGIEAHFATNYLGHFLMTNLLVDKIVKSNGIVVNVSSTAYTLAETNTDDPNFNDGKDYHPWVAYGRSKTANILFTYALAEKYRGDLVSLVADPGMAHDSQLLVNNAVDDAFLADGIKLAGERMPPGHPPPMPTLVSMQQAIATGLRAALDPELKASAPAFLKECNIASTLPYAHDKAEALKLWHLSEKLVRERFGLK